MMKEAGAKSVSYIKNADLKEGAQFNGVFIKSSVDKKFGKTEYYIQSEETTYVLKETGALRRRMGIVPIGSLVEITYLGKSKIKAGEWAGSDAHDFKVLYDDTYKAPVTAAAPTPPAPSKAESEDAPF